VISKQDILDRAVEWNLRAEIVEKDYVLGWLLAAFAQHPLTSRSWVFKGGTCLKKCFFETYRFSEDLDFSLLPEAAYTEADIQQVIVEVAAGAAELSGIEIPVDRVAVRPRQDKLGRATFEAKLAYRGPLRMPNWPKLSFDITAHEPVLATTARRPVYHAYADALPSGVEVQCYSLNELFAEKSRALFERSRPRDLYDVVYIAENCGDRLESGVARDLFRQKCRVKGREPPTAKELLTIVSEGAALRGDWSAMLAHQLPNLPPIDTVIARLGPALSWLEETPAPTAPALPFIALQSRGVIEAPHGIRYWGKGIPLEAVRFAGTNRLLISFTYDRKPRLVEPYSLRRPATGNLLLFGWEVSAGQIKAFNVDEMVGLQATSTPFVPRFRVELAALG